MERRINEQWISALRGPGRDEAIGDLRALLMRGLRGALSRQRGVSDAAVEDFA